MKLRLSSRQSALAQAQAYQVGAALQKAHPGIEIEYLFRESLGDKNLTDPLWKMPEKGVFTEDFYQDLVENRTEMVVHSWKDLPTEEKPATHIVGTLPRADQRDLLLFKKSSFKKYQIKIYSSSPRRAHNIKPFLGWAIPWPVQSLEFQSVRGNIPTRIQKLLEANEIDGLIVAKAALDRLLEDSHFPDTVSQLRKNLTQLDWMILPLSENPNAAAQGAIAIEISRSRPDVLKLIEKINCASTFLAADRERKILQEYGGGCHLALGMSVLDRAYGKIEIVKGLTPKGEIVSTKKFFPKKAKPQGIKVGRMDFLSLRVAKDLEQSSLEKIDALFVAKAEAYSTLIKSTYIWAAGLQTWKKLSAQGVWVHGSSESLGEIEEPRIEILAGQKLHWARMTHEDAQHGLNHENSVSYKKNFGTYSLELELTTTQLDDAQAFLWKSGSEFLLAVQRFPELKKRFHICGPGRTYDTILRYLESQSDSQQDLTKNIFVELNDEFVTVV